MKPLASLADGWVASSHGLLAAVAVVSVLALVLGVAELCLPRAWREHLRSWARRWATVWERRYQTAVPIPLVVARKDQHNQRDDSSQWQVTVS